MPLLHLPSELLLQIADPLPALDILSLRRTCTTLSCLLSSRLLSLAFTHRGRDGESVLYSACKSGNVRLVSLLLSHGASVSGPRGLVPSFCSWPDLNELTPLHISVLHGQVEVARLLLQRGADVNAGREIRCVTPLHIAVMVRFVSTTMVRLLLEHGADEMAWCRVSGVPTYTARVPGEVRRLLSLRGEEAIDAAEASGGNTPYTMLEMRGEQWPEVCDDAFIMAYCRYLQLLSHRVVPVQPEPRRWNIRRLLRYLFRRGLRWMLGL